MKLELLVVNKNNIVSLPLSFAVLTIVSLSNAHAEFDPAVVKVGAVDIVPTVDIAESYDSNILFASKAKQTDYLTKISPAVIATIESGANKYSIKAGASIGRYATSGQDDFVDSDVAISLRQSFTRKANLDVDAARLNQHESRGLNYSQGANFVSLSAPDQYQTNQLKTKFSYGSRDSIGRIVLNAGVKSRAFNTRRDITKSRDLEDVSAGATFYYHFMPKTSLLFELSQKQLTYSNNTKFNSKEQRFLAGARWDVSSLTSGTAKAGLLEKDFADTSKADSSTFSWEVGARWTPRTYSTIDLITKGVVDESNSVVDNYIDSKAVVVKWVHFWNKHVDTQLNVNATNFTYQPSSRRDKYRSASVKLNYNFRRWMDVSMAYQYAENDSTAINISYDKNLVTLGLALGL